MEVTVYFEVVGGSRNNDSIRNKPIALWYKVVTAAVNLPNSYFASFIPYPSPPVRTVT